VNQLYWTVAEVVDLLAEAPWVNQSGQGFNRDLVTLEALIQANRPEVLEQIWVVWED